MGTGKRILVYAFGAGLPLGGALGAISGKGWEMVAIGCLMGVAIAGLYGSVFIGAESLVKKMPPKLQRLMLKRVLPGDSVISTGPLADAGTRQGRE
jgi:hypothetical protein